MIKARCEQCDTAFKAVGSVQLMLQLNMHRTLTKPNHTGFTGVANIDVRTGNITEPAPVITADDDNYVWVQRNSMRFSR